MIDWTMEICTETHTTVTKTIVTKSKSVKKSTKTNGKPAARSSRGRKSSSKLRPTTREDRKSAGIRGKWSEEKMQKAIEAVKDNTLGLNKAAKFFCVPKATLQRHVHGTNKRAREGMKSLGRSTDLPLEIENDLVEHILLLESRFYGLTRTSLLSLAFQIAEINNISTRFNTESRRAGKEWLRRFLLRHPELSLRIPEATSLARAAGFNRQRVSEFYKILDKLVDDERLTPDRVYNMDETGFTAVQKPQKVFAKKGKHQVGAITSSERGKNVTFVCCVSASGSYVPPLVIYPRKRLKNELTEGAPSGSIFACQKNGWINVELFSVWMEHFISIVKPSNSKKVLLILDGHVSHTQNITALLRAREAGVILLSLPPHCTHRLQPLDVTFFKPLSTYYNQCIDRWMRGHPGLAVSEQKITQFFGEAYGKAASIATAVNGFRTAGIWPVNPNVIDVAEFAPSDVTERPLPASLSQTSEAQISTACPQTVELLVDSEDGHTTTMQLELFSDADVDATGVDLHLVHTSTVAESSIVTAIVGHGDLCDSLQPLSAEASNQLSIPAAPISAAKICPLPVRQSAVVRKRTSMGATVLTSSPYKVALEERISNKSVKLKSIEQKLMLKKEKEIEKTKSNNNDEFVAPAKTKKAPAIKTKSRKKAVMHGQADDEYVVPAKTKKAAAIKSKSRKKAVMHDQADDEYVAPAKKNEDTSYDGKG